MMFADIGSLVREIASPCIPAGDEFRAPTTFEMPELVFSHAHLKNTPAHTRGELAQPRGIFGVQYRADRQWVKYPAGKLRLIRAEQILALTAEHRSRGPGRSFTFASRLRGPAVTELRDDMALLQFSLPAAQGTGAGRVDLLILHCGSHVSQFFAKASTLAFVTAVSAESPTTGGGFLLRWSFSTRRSTDL